MPPKKGKKKKLPKLELPVEDVLTEKMNFEKLQKHAVRIGNELNELRKERSLLERDRDKMAFYWDAAMFQLMKIERDIRHMEREVLNKHFEGHRTVHRTDKDVQNLYFDQGKLWAEKKVSFLISTYEGYSHNFIKEEQLFKDRLDLKKDYFTMLHEQDQARAGSRIQVSCKKMDDMIRTHLRHLRALEMKDEALCEAYFSTKLQKVNDKEMSEMLFKKNKEVKTFERNHIALTKEILHVYENVTKHNFSLINNLRNEINEFRREEIIIVKEYNTVKKQYDKTIDIIRRGDAELLGLKRKLQDIEILQKEADVAKQRYQEGNWFVTILDLKINWLEEYLEKEVGIVKQARQDLTQSMLGYRQKQTKMTLWMEMIGQQLQKGAHEREQLVKRCSGKGFPGVLWLLDQYNEFNSIRLTTIDVIRRCLRLHRYSLDSLGFKVNMSLGPIRQPEPGLDTQEPPLEVAGFPRVRSGRPFIEAFLQSTQLAFK